jgi:mono/diheme cytochrome c family protein
MRSDSKRNDRLVTLGIVAMFIFGLVVPAFVLADNGLHKASAGPAGIHLDANETKGRELFAHTCAVCHTLSAVKSVGRTGPNLDVLVGHQISTPAARKAFVQTTVLNGVDVGLGNMPAGLYEGKNAEDVAEFVAAVAGH